jgi:peptide/nickel transport system substrate-binding protein
MEFAANTGPQLGLASEITPNADATVWTIRLKKGIEFHDGKELTADDVIFSFNRIVKNKFSGASLLDYINLAGLKSLDRYTVEVPMTAPYSIFREILVYEGTMSIVPVGYDTKHPVGTGPFKYKSFTPGVQSTFGRNPNYWRTGEPYVDEVVITDFSDETSQDNALLSGEITCADQLTQASIPALRSGGITVNVWKGNGWVPFTMRVDVPPFNDVSVRQALRLVVNRPQMRELAYGGYGLLGNDIFGIADPEYDRLIPQREQDIDQAKYLLKQAGHEGLTTTLVTADIHSGAVEMAEVLKQQAAAAGITINLAEKTTDAFFVNYLNWPFSQDWWDGGSYLSQVLYSMVPAAPWDETHWDKSPYAKRYYSLTAEALRTTDDSKQTEIVHEMMEIDYNYGTYIIPAFNPVICAQSPHLRGVVTQSSTAMPWVNYYFRSLWLDD